MIDYKHLLTTDLTGTGFYSEWPDIRKYPTPPVNRFALNTGMHRVKPGCGSGHSTGIRILILQLNKLRSRTVGTAFQAGSRFKIHFNFNPINCIDSPLVYFSFSSIFPNISIKNIL